MIDLAVSPKPRSIRSVPQMRGKVLAVDDEPACLKLIEQALSRTGLEIVEATRGDSVLATLEEHPDVDVAVMDRNMPGMDGLVVAQAMSKDPRWRRIPVVIQTGRSSVADVTEGIRAGVYYYLTKPYKSSMLLAVVRAALMGPLGNRWLRDPGTVVLPPFGRLVSGRFSFRSLDEARNLAQLIAAQCPEPEVVVCGLVELTINAIEHGNLGISYQDKTALVLAGRWEEEVGRRLTLPEYRDRAAELELESDATSIGITISDRGPGFDSSAYLEFCAQRAMDPNGRGIALARQVAFPSLEYLGNGNTVHCTIPLNRA